MAAHKQSHLYVMGQVGRMYFQRRARAGELDVDTEFIYTTQNPTLYRSRRIAEQMLKAFDDGDLDDVYIIYTDMVSSITFEPNPTAPAAGCRAFRTERG